MTLPCLSPFHRPWPKKKDPLGFRRERHVRSVRQALELQNALKAHRTLSMAVGGKWRPKARGGGGAGVRVPGLPVVSGIPGFGPSGFWARRLMGIPPELTGVFVEATLFAGWLKGKRTAKNCLLWVVPLFGHVPRWTCTSFENTFL